MAPIDPIALTQALIRCPSVTPEDRGALGVLESALKPSGFVCHRLRFDAENSPPVENLYARLGTDRPNFCFAGHTDVVPPGDTAMWGHDPFGAHIADGMLWGRGAADMKSAIAAFVAAVSRHLKKIGKPKGSISLLITGDEEDVAVNGTVKVLDWLKGQGETLDHCLVGEPTSAVRVGDVIKIGRRGSMNVRAIVKGTQGHAAYPNLSLNPIPIMADLIVRLSSVPLDEGSAHFEPSTLAFTTVDVGNPTVNVTPADIRAGFNIRFNDLHTPDSLMAHFRRIADAIVEERCGAIEFVNSVSGVSFVTQPGPYTALLSEAVARVTGTAPDLSTTGGTSDARFIKDHCPVAEIGLQGRTMHKANECASLDDIETLTRVYETILELYFAEEARS
jgi:succinyl-diaminopimelate desuccinylase